MKRRILSIIVTAAMLLSMVSMLASCDEEEIDTQGTEAPSEEITTGENESNGNESDPTGETKETDEGESKPVDSEKETSNETETYPDISNTEYNNGGTVKNSGTDWDDEAFALVTNRKINESRAVEKSAAEMLELLKDKNSMAEGEVYKVTEPLVLSSNTKYYGNLAAVIAEGGIVIKDAEEIVIKELVVKGKITVENSKGITFFKLDLIGSDIGVGIDSASYDVAFKSCVIKATDTAISSDAELVSVYQSYVCADKGIVSSGDELAVQNTYVDAKAFGISSSGAYCTVKNNLIEADSNGVGVELTKGSSNGLVALNIIKDVQLSVSINEGYNCVVLLNSAVKVSAKDTTNLYIVENALGGAIELENNKYLLCEGNKFPVDGKPHPVINLSNTEYNGDNIHDVTARLEYGANEELLPHTNKDLFVGMDRQANVRDISLTKSYSFTNYIRTMARQSSVVIVPPGAYSVSTSSGTVAALNLDASHANTTLYAYGVLEEMNADENTIYGGDVYAGMGRLLSISGNNINVHGLTMGYDFQSAGQAYVLEKWTETDPVTNKDILYVRLISGAGFYDGIADSNKNVYSTGMQIAKGDMSYSYIRNIGYEFIQEDLDGTVIFKITEKAKFDTLEVGDVFGCRLAGENNQSIGLTGSNLLLKDCVLYGYSAALAIVGNGRNAKNIRLERVHNTSKSSPIIDKETYDKYIALEEQYGMTSDGNDPLAKGAQGLEVYIDEQGRYRGSLPRWGSVDATHITGSAQGVSATSCIFEHMVDDASNQRGSSSRIAGVADNGDGTTTIYVKGSLAQTYHNRNTNLNGLTTAYPTNTSQFIAGDTVFAYNSEGVVLIEADVLAVKTGIGDVSATCHIAHVDANKDCICDYVSCKAILHTDLLNNDTSSVDPDCKCDACGAKVHTDYLSSTTYDGRGNNKCNNCSKVIMDTDKDGFDDYDKGYVLRDMMQAGQTTYNPAYSVLTYKAIGSYNGKRYIITYNTTVYALTVKTSDVNFDALEGFDLTDNDYFMEEKIICDNVSLVSAGFSFDNVLMQEYSSRGILMKTRNSTVKNCTFRDVAMTAMLLSIETTWGESTVPKNTTIESCLFDNTSHDFANHTTKRYAPIALQGLGDSANPNKVINENNLPCENINIIGNKFINTNNIYVMTLFDSKNVKIKDNIIEVRSLKEDDQFHTDHLTDKNGNNVIDEKLGRAFYIERCINVEISGNTIICGEEKLETGNHIIAYDYKNLYGDNLYDADGNRYESLPQDNDQKPAT